MNKKVLTILKCSAIIISCIILAVICNYLIFNFSLLKLDSTERVVSNITDYDVKQTDEYTTINFNLDSTYINKLVISYECSEDTELEISYSATDYYGNLATNDITDTFDCKLSSQVTNLKATVSSIELTFDSNVIVNSIQIDNTINLNFYIIIYISAMLLCICILIYFYRKNEDTKNLYKYFIAIGLIIGITLIILQPATTFYSYDDQIHFMNTMQYFGGNRTWSNTEYSLLDETGAGIKTVNSIEEQLEQQSILNSDTSSGYTIYNTRFLTYDKVAYTACALGYHIFNLIGIPFTICFKFGQFMGLLFYILIMAYAIKISKIGKRIITVLGLLPTSIYLACQYSYDPVVTSGLTLAFVVLMNWFIDEKEKINFKSMATFICAILYGCFPKAIYIPLILFFLFIPHNRFKDKKQEIWLKTGITLLFILIIMTFLTGSTFSASAGGDTRGGTANVSEQVKLILTHPIGYIKVLKDTALELFSNKMIGMSTIGQIGYYHQISSNVYYIYLILLIFVAFTDTKSKSLSILQRLILLGLTLGIILLIWTALYLSYTSVASTTIKGVQNRYFIPLILPLIMCLQSTKIRNYITDDKYNMIVLTIPALVLFISIFELILTNYCL